MKRSALLKRLDNIRKEKDTLKRLYQQSIDVLHKFEVELHLLLEDVSKEKAK